jgi:hypothetical protein
MRPITLVLALLLSGPAAAGEREIVTAPGAVLCLDPVSVEPATRSELSQQSLRRLHCMRTQAGIPSTLLSESSQLQVWQVLFRPPGISGGVRLWARPAAFTAPDGAPLHMQRASR